jgi:hypothetical protein
MQINQYANEAFTINDEDWYDVDWWNGTTWETRKISGATLKSILQTPAVWGGITGNLSDQTDLQSALDLKQDDLVSGLNIKTLEGQSLLGSGNIDLTKTDVGLSNVDNTSDLNKPISTATQTALNGKENTSNKGIANGYASLDGTGKVPASELPSYVDDVIEVANYAALPVTGETGKIYITIDDNKVYRWSGSVYVQISTPNAIWGSITGTLSSQTDLQNALNAKFDDPAGTSAQYIDGTGALQTFPTFLASDNLITEVYNSTGATLTKGTIVYINGGQGNLPTITKAQANSDATSAQTFGWVRDDISNMSNGFVVVIGKLENLNTNGLGNGTQLYLSPTIAGTYTTTKPVAPQHLVYVGIVVRDHPTQGVIEVKIQNGYELDEIHDVKITSPVDGQFLTWDATQSVWKNASAASTTQIELDPVINLLNTPPASPSDGDRYRIGTSPTGVWVGKNNQIAQWSAGTSAWVYTIPVTDNIVFQTATSTTFRYNGTGWVQWAGTPLLQNGNTLGNVVKFGTTDNFNVEVYRNNVRRFIFGTNGFYFAKTNISGSLVQSAYFNGVGLTDNRTLAIPDKDGTLAVLDDLTKVSIRTSTINTTLQLADAGQMIEMNLAAANNLTIPTFAGVQFPVGTVILISQYGAGQTTIVPSVGVTLRSSGGKTKLSGQYAQASLTKRATDEWYLSGDITL